MSIPNLTEATLRRHSTSKSFQRGEDYYRGGAVIEICQRGNHLFAEVEGNNVDPYYVHIAFDAGGITKVDCTCPYDFEGWCKHTVATALTWLRDQQRIQQRPSLEQLLDQLDPIQTQRLVQELVAEQPSLLNQVDRWVSQVTRSTPVVTVQAKRSPKRQASLDFQSYRAQVQRLMRDALNYWEEGWDEDPIEIELPDILDQAQAFTERGDGESALAILEIITQACVEDWDEITEYGGESDLLINLLDPVWAEAILSTSFQPGDEVEIQLNLEGWEDRLGSCFEMSAEALRQGWDASGLAAVLRGESTDLWDDTPPNYADSLAQIRLRILDRQERVQEYLNLAWAEDQIQEYLTMLIRLGRIADVMAAQDRLASAAHALVVAKALREQGALPEALAIAQRGLTLPESKPWQHRWGTGEQAERTGVASYPLADWTSELAEGLGQTSVALEARIEAFKARPSFQDYQKVQALAGEAWAAIKPELLHHLRQQNRWNATEAKVAIFLHEALIDDAIAAVDPSGSGQLVRQVMAAAIAQRSVWVIEKARRPAEEIMNRGKSEAYQEVVEWLSLARAAYIESGQEAKWKRYYTDLRSTHFRKRKLMGLFQKGNLG
ncbi:MAG: hypothetical protein MH252_04800 [Thermosynechococcaceae cyanobacterium MS004]|nr:hypothetical protein [Thermosynechococcaceae cyanobacterium MS004]